MNWNCACGYRWDTCKSHSRYNTSETTHRKNTACGQSTEPSKTSYKRRCLLPATYEEILADDLKKARLKRTQREDLDRMELDLGVRKHKRIRMDLLGPKLRSRFMGVVR